MATFIGLIMNSKCQQTLINFIKQIMLNYGHTFYLIFQLFNSELNWRKTSNLPMFIIIALTLKLSTLEAQ